MYIFLKNIVSLFVERFSNVKSVKIPLKEEPLATVVRAAATNASTSEST